MRTIQNSLYALTLLLLASCTGQPKITEKADHDLQLSDSAISLYRQHGQAIVQQSFKALSQALTTAIEEGGVEHAIQFCNVQALPITDSMAQLFHADVQRVSLKNRNPVNLADSIEAGFIYRLEQKMLNGIEVNDTLFVSSDGKMTFLAPILMAPACLKCHGTEGKEMTSQTLAAIGQLYPQDKATGYQLGELRGLWRVRFNQ